MLKSCVYLFIGQNYEFQGQKSIAISKINGNGNMKLIFAIAFCHFKFYNDS